MFNVTIDYPKHGWSRLEIKTENDVVDLRISYLTDALGDIIRGLRSYALGSNEIFICWYTEPNQVELRFNRDRDTTRILVHELKDNFPFNTEKTSLTSETIFNIRTKWMIGQFISAFDRMMEGHTPEDYHRDWINFPFPHDSFQELKELHRATDYKK